MIDETYGRIEHIKMYNIHKLRPAIKGRLVAAPLANPLSRTITSNGNLIDKYSLICYSFPIGKKESGEQAKTEGKADASDKTKH